MSLVKARDEVSPGSDGGKMNAEEAKKEAERAKKTSIKIVSH